MNCETAREHMLQADLADLRGEGAGELAQHLRACQTCGERARRILEQTTALAATLERAAPRTAAATIRRGGAAWKAPRRWAVAVPLALAASVAVMVLVRNRTGQAPVSAVTLSPAVAAAPLDVQVRPGRAVTVFQTDNPNIVVIWSF